MVSAFGGPLDLEYFMFLYALMTVGLKINYLEGFESVTPKYVNAHMVLPYSIFPHLSALPNPALSLHPFIIPDIL